MSRSEVIMIESWRALICMTFLDYKHSAIFVDTDHNKRSV